MDIRYNLVFQEPIEFQDIKIYQSEIEEIFKYGIEKYNNLLLPYSVTMELFDIPEEQKLNLKVFDVLLREQNLLSYLLLSLKLICKTDNIGLCDSYIIIDEGILHRDNFDEFASIILQINSREKIKIDKLPDNPKQREIELKLRKGRERFEKKNEISIWDIINIVKFGGKFKFTNEEIKKMTLWQLMNAYKCKLGISNYEDSFEIYLVSGDKDTIKNHWTQYLKVES